MSLSAGKLYVTEPDERSGPKRRYFCGLFGCVLLLAVLVVAVLIGGVFLLLLLLFSFKELPILFSSWGDQASEAA